MAFILDGFVVLFDSNIWAPVLVWCQSKPFFFFLHSPINPAPHPPPTHSLECLSNVMMKHNLAPGVKDKPTGLCWAASVSCRLSRVMNISYGLVANHYNLKMNEVLYNNHFRGNGSWRGILLSVLVELSVHECVSV